MSRDGSAPLTACITVNGSRAEISLGKKLPPDCWHQEAELVKGLGATKELAVINKQTAQARIKLETLYFFLSSQQEQVTATMLKKAYKGDSHEGKERARTICQVANYKYSIFARQVKRKLRSGNTLKRWHCTKRKLRHFLHYKFGKWNVLLSSIKYAHAQDFMNYLTLQDGIEENSAGGTLRMSRSFCRSRQTGDG